MKKRTKYRAIPTVVDGVRFASKAEAKRYEQLRVLERGKEISGLELQPKYRCEVNGVKVCDYIADFRYRLKGAGLVVEDVKGVETAVFRLKRKLVKALHGVDVHTVRVR